MKVQEQLAFLASIHGLSLAESDRRAAAWLERVGLASREQALTRDLSKGMQQKVQFAAAVIHDPEVVVLDEPFSGLDPINSRLLKDLILEQQAKGTTVILSTHRMEEVEALCESICLVSRGRAVLDGRVREIKARYGRNTITVEHTSGAGKLAQVSGVQQCEDTPTGSRLQLAPAADPHRVMRDVLDFVPASSIRMDEPRLEDIYVEMIHASEALA
jgi:ABC-2 type transport system ATP-binding protein